ncbi:MAG: hypothetical protein ACI8PB_005353 [Desulforhopalus sp.]|jgi:hypothetical protein
MNKEYYLELRNRYKLGNIKKVLILGSPPASGTSIYDENLIKKATPVVKPIS